ncbi:hypothetical protein P9726_03315 [Geobacillus stearothermophilus]|uniref:hypothetical protein n=1 Tax=Geobacillus stearothermophilus TaxID=1422 RepID=UPI002E24EAE9|nr:hypothetical protein [Geobacillus stearothermophilus]
MFGEGDFFGSWFNFIFLVGLTIIALLVLKVILDIAETFYNNNTKFREFTEDTFYWLAKTPNWIKKPLKFIGVIVYLAFCLFLIAYSST